MQFMNIKNKYMKTSTYLITSKNSLHKYVPPTYRMTGRQAGVWSEDIFLSQTGSLLKKTLIFIGYIWTRRAILNWPQNLLVVCEMMLHHCDRDFSKASTAKPGNDLSLALSYKSLNK